jgi:creatinine amidohydrolase/Fe(II)-dependent formamide hydrolase-like protein
MKLAECTPEEYQKAMESKPAIIIPVGAMEWHDEHLPIGFDYLKIEKISELIADHIGCFVSPPISFGYPHHMSKEEIRGKSTFCPEFDPLFQYVLAIGKMLVDKNFKVIYFLSGHYERSQVYMLKLISRLIVDYGRDNGKELISIAHHEPDFTIKKGISPNAKEDYVRKDPNIMYFQGDHAGFYETSVALYLMPKLVRINKIKKQYSNEKYGAPSKEYGKIWLDMIVEKASSEILAALDGKEPDYKDDYFIDRL